MNIAIASIITAPLSGWILTWSDWRMLFIIEGIFPFLIAAPLWWLLVADRPRDASWVSDSERDYIEEALAAEHEQQPETKSYREALRNSTVWRLVAVYFLIQLGFYGLNLWLPTLVEKLSSAGYGTVGVLTAIPYVAAMIGLWLNGYLADRTGRYSLHVFGALLIGAAGLAASVLVGSGGLVLSIVFLSLAMGGALAYDGPFWASASRAMPAAVAGGAMGLINAIGNLGGFVGPYAAGYLQDKSGSFVSTAITLAIALASAGVVMLTVGVGGATERERKRSRLAVE